MSEQATDTGIPVTDHHAAADDLPEVDLTPGTATTTSEDVLEDGIAFAGVSRYPARVKCALLGWMAWKDATAQAVAHSTGGTP